VLATQPHNPELPCARHGHMCLTKLRPMPCILRVTACCAQASVFGGCKAMSMHDTAWRASLKLMFLCRHTLSDPSPPPQFESATSWHNLADLAQVHARVATCLNPAPLFGTPFVFSSLGGTCNLCLLCISAALDMDPPFGFCISKRIYIYVSLRNEARCTNTQLQILFYT